MWDTQKVLPKDLRVWTGRHAKESWLEWAKQPEGSRVVHPGWEGVFVMARTQGWHRMGSGRQGDGHAPWEKLRAWPQTGQKELETEGRGQCTPSLSRISEVPLGHPWNRQDQP